MAQRERSSYRWTRRTAFALSAVLGQKSVLNATVSVTAARMEDQRFNPPLPAWAKTKPWHVALPNCTSWA